MRTNLFKITIIFGALFSYQCTHESTSFNDSYLDENVIKLNYADIPFDEKGKQIEKFGKGISEALKIEAFRELIKQEALKKFNLDYDVLYHSIKDLPVDGIDYEYATSSTQIRSFSSSSSLHDFLVPFFDSEQELNEYENKIPTLSIFVPKLPLNSFSAESWDTSDESQTPDVALRLDNITPVPVIGSDGENYIIEPEDTPAYPIVVLKENERVISSNAKGFDDYDTRIMRTRIFSFRFIDNLFDPEFNLITTNPTSFSGASDDSIPNDLKSAYNLFANDPYAWHRDNIYYGLTPTNTSGPINGGKYREYIATFKLIASSPKKAYDMVSDSFNEEKEDPKLRDSWQRRRHGVSAWTDGHYEFSIKCSQGAKASHLGPSANRGFAASAEDLFEIEWERKDTGWWIWKKVYLKPKITKVKTLNTAVPNGLRLEFSTWDLNNFSNHWKFAFSEKDAAETVTLKETRSAKYNTNFDFNPTTGNLEKIGLKLGGSYETSRTSEFTVAYTAGDDGLKHTDVNFYDNPLSKENGKFILRKFSTGRVEFSLVPVQVQF